MMNALSIFTTAVTTEFALTLMDHNCTCHIGYDGDGHICTGTFITFVVTINCLFYRHKRVFQ